MKLIKTDARNRLTVTVLTDAMRIKLLCPSISEFEPTDAIHAWMRHVIAPADQIIKRLAALAVELVMHHTQSHRVTVATMKIVPKQRSDS